MNEIQVVNRNRLEAPEVNHLLEEPGAPKVNHLLEELGAPEVNCLQKERDVVLNFKSP
ncbi:hypothetical protein ACLOJK_011165 [Asimina triloba]